MVSMGVRSYPSTHTHVCRHSWFSYTALAVCRLTTTLLPAALTAKQSTEAHRALSSMTRWSIIVHTTAEHMATVTAIPGPTSPAAQTNTPGWSHSHTNSDSSCGMTIFFPLSSVGTHTNTQTLTQIFEMRTFYYFILSAVADAVIALNLPYV